LFFLSVVDFKKRRLQTSQALLGYFLRHFCRLIPAASGNRRAYNWQINPEYSQVTAL
jgi:hypothetical protein